MKRSLKCCFSNSDVYTAGLRIWIQCRFWLVKFGEVQDSPRYCLGFWFSDCNLSKWEAAAWEDWVQKSVLARRAWGGPTGRCLCVDQWDFLDCLGGGTGLAGSLGTKALRACLKNDQFEKKLKFHGGSSSTSPVTNSNFAFPKIAWWELIISQNTWVFCGIGQCLHVVFPQIKS